MVFNERITKVKNKRFEENGALDTMVYNIYY